MTTPFKVQKARGEFPENVRVANELVTFDEGGVADVSEAVAAVLELLPHEYRFLDADGNVQAVEQASEGGEGNDGDNDEGTQEGDAEGQGAASEEVIQASEVVETATPEVVAEVPAAAPVAEVVAEAPAAPAAPKRTAPASRPAASKAK